ncbi:hypothetical protein BGW42_000521 [Actinomortierella wolfii]|nr:hypothetical protein BGW42_000521 [Actinomortierella wolfii]
MATLDNPLPPAGSKRTPFDVTELQALIGSKLDRASLASACAVSRSWYQVYMPILWNSVHFTHDLNDDHYDHLYNPIDPPARWGYTSSVASSLSSSPTSSSSSSPPSSFASTPSLLSTTFPVSSSPSGSPPRGSLSAGDALVHGYHQLNLEHTTNANGRSRSRRRSSNNIHSKIIIPFSRNRVLRGLVRNGHWIFHLCASGITDQEMEIIGQHCTNLRELDLQSGRYSAENLTELFQRLKQNLQIVRFQSCVALQDIFKPLECLANLQEIELHGSFVANTITARDFFESYLFPMLRACPSLSSMVIKGVYVIDQYADQAGSQPPAAYLMHQHGSLDNITPESMVARPEFLTFLKNTADRPNYPQLKHLTLECSDIPDSVILELLIRCPNLERLTLLHSRELSDTTLFLLQYTCPRLRALSLTRAESVTLSGFILLLSAFSGVTELDLSGNMLSDQVLERLSLLTELSDLNLEYCEGITDAGIRSVLMQCRRLQSFNFLHITGLSNRLWGDLVPTATGDGPGVCLPLADQGWACQDSLQSLHVPELASFGQRQYLTPAVIASLAPSYRTASARFLEENQLIQRRLASLERLSDLTIGGHTLQLRTVLSNRKNPHLLERLHLKRLDKKMTMDDAHWLIHEAAPNLKQLRIPVLGNFVVSSWLNEMRPGLVS